MTFTDDFIFSQVMKNKDICKSLIETILKIKVGKIEFLTSQYEIEIEPEWLKLLLLYIQTYLYFNLKKYLKKV